MDIRWLGGACVRLQSKDRTLVVDPPADQDPGAADVVAYTRGAPRPAAPRRSPDAAFVIDGPGEYEVGGLFVIGVGTPVDVGAEDGLDGGTTYSIEADGIVVCHVGPRAERPTQDDAAAIGAVDVLLIVAEAGAQEAGRVADFVSEFEPSLVVPLAAPGGEAPALETARRLVADLGVAADEPVDSLQVTPTTLPVEPKAVLLRPRPPV